MFSVSSCSVRSWSLYLIFSPYSGRFLVEKIQKEGPEAGLQLAFVWNRNADKLRDSLPKELILHDLSDFTRRYICICIHIFYVCMHMLSICLNGRETHYCGTYRCCMCVCFRDTDVIVEVCHPMIVKEFGLRFLSHAHFLVTSLFNFILSPEILSCLPWYLHLLHDDN